MKRYKLIYMSRARTNQEYYLCSEADAEIRRLEEDNARLREERYVLLASSARLRSAISDMLKEARLQTCNLNIIRDIATEALNATKCEHIAEPVDNQEQDWEWRFGEITVTGTCVTPCPDTGYGIGSVSCQECERFMGWVGDRERSSTVKCRLPKKEESND